MICIVSFIPNNENHSMLRRLTSPVLLPTWWQDLFLAIPRIVCGYLLAADFGADKFGMPWSPVDKNLGLFEVAYWFPIDVANYGGIFAIFPAFFAWMGGFSEAVGGVMWLVGFQTRIASFLIFATMIVAIFMQQIKEGMWNTLPALGFLWIAMYCLTLGSGRFGFDYLVSKKWKNEKK
jgi:putative oxidoreductase